MTIRGQVAAAVGLVLGLASPVIVACSTSRPTSSGDGVLSGTVYYDLNQNGRQDPGEPGVEGLPVDWETGGDHAAPTTNPRLIAFTDASGHYTLKLSNSPPGWLHVRTGWFRSRCGSTYCSAGGSGDTMITDNEQLWSGTSSTPVSGSRTFDAGLIPDAGQTFAGRGNGNGPYAGYPPSLRHAHRQDLSARVTSLLAVSCRPAPGGVACPLGTTVEFGASALNSGLTPVSGVTLVAQLPYGVEFRSATLLPGLSSRTATGVRVTGVAPAAAPDPAAERATPANYSTVRLTLAGSIPAAGLAYVRISAFYRSGSTSSGRVMFGITDERNRGADTDSQFCPSPAVPTSCAAPPATTHSILDRVSDDTDSAGMRILR